MSPARLYLSAAHKSSGKTTVTIGLCTALRARGLKIQTFKKGPDYIDPMWLTLASGRPCHNLDFHTMEVEEIDALFARGASAAHLSLIEGNKGLHDGMDPAGSDCNAALARQLRAPVVLVLDAAGITRGIAPLLLGLKNFEPVAPIAGVILNNVASERHEGKLRAVLERYTDIPVFGALRRSPDLHIDERHLGLVPANEARQARARIEAIARYVSGGVDLDTLLQAAGVTPDGARRPSPQEPPASPRGDVRIGVLRDQAFGFYYATDLEAFPAQGAELVFIDALNDEQLPALDGLFLGGGFPETHLDPLSQNRPLRGALRDALTGGLPAYAECGGLMYLCRSLTWRGRKADMVGVIPADALMHERPQGRGYAALRPTGAGPWQPAFTGTQIPAHEFHYSSLEGLPDTLVYAYAMARGSGISAGRDGIVLHNLIASYTHLRDTSRCRWVKPFVDFVRSVKNK